MPSIRLDRPETTSSPDNRVSPQTRSSVSFESFQVELAFQGRVDRSDQMAGGFNGRLPGRGASHSVAGQISSAPWGAETFELGTCS